MWLLRTASLTRTTNQPAGLISKMIFIGPAVGGDHKIGVRKNPTWIIDGSNDLRSRLHSVSRAKIATGNINAGRTSNVSGTSKSTYQVNW
jgi:hypothetical protein